MAFRLQLEPIHRIALEPELVQAPGRPKAPGWDHVAWERMNGTLTGLWGMTTSVIHGKGFPKTVLFI